MLVKQIDELGIDCEDKRKNALMRSAIWNHFQDDLQLSETELEVASKDGDIKSIWDKLQLSLPYYSLFQSDRKNSVGASNNRQTAGKFVDVRNFCTFAGEIEKRVRYAPQK